MGIFKTLGDLYAGWQASKLGDKQQGMSQDMIAEAQALSAAYERPEMKTPESINKMMSMLQSRQYQDMPGLSTMKNQLGQSTAQGMDAIEGMGVGAEGMGAMANLYSNQMGQGQNLSIQNAMFKDDAELDYLGGLEGIGNWEQKAWQWNEADPYMQAQQKAAMLESAGRSGEWEGMKTEMGAWANTFQGIGGGADDTMSQIMGMLGGGGGGGGTPAYTPPQNAQPSYNMPYGGS